jgi:hypothetical protein
LSKTLSHTLTPYRHARSFPTFITRASALLSLLQDLSVNVLTAILRVYVEERPLPEAELVASLWQGLMAQVDWSAHVDQMEGLALREVLVRRPASTVSINI